MAPRAVSRHRVCLEIMPMEAAAERRIARHFGVDPGHRRIGWRGGGERLMRMAVVLCAGTAVLAGSLALLA